MITAELRGKLCNMMCEIATIEGMGHRTGIPTAYPNVDQNIDDLAKPQPCSSEPNGREYFKLFKNFDWHKNHDGDMHCDRIVNVPFHYVPIVPQDYTKYIGFFQSELYFPDRDFTLKLFEPADFIVERLKKYKDIVGKNKAAIHVRRGDYIRLSHTYNVLNMDYYAKAMLYLANYGVREYLVFSNDAEWCRESFKGNQFTHIKDDQYTELYLMSQCAHQIIANSTYSWWGAYLNNKPNRQIVAPLVWFSTNKNNSQDIIPLNWTKL